jgi:ketosteroid isomerase-like protein
MTKPLPTLAAETSALREAYAAFNRNDYAAFGQLFDPQVEWIEPSDSPAGATYRGRDAVLAHFATARAMWAEGSCQPQRIIAAGDRLIQLVHVHVRLKHETDWRDGDVAEVYTFRDGKIIQVRIFFDVAQGLQWAGVKATDATAAE